MTPRSNLAQTVTPCGVEAPDGSFIGVQTATGRQFLGIAYAEPPVGPLRWAAPKRLATKPEQRLAHRFGADAIQPDPPTNDPQPGHPMRGSEDCLYLNVYAPRAHSANEPTKPVMVWIHGGAFIFGSGREIEPHAFVEKHEVIVVTINYRLGALGFLSHPALGEASGNFGILDQQMALHWVQRNIAAFGGDAGRVTIFGESAGGVSVFMQLLSPGAKGLFSRAIIQSGPCKALDRVIADKRGLTYAKSAGCASSGDAAAIDCLRRLPAEMAAALSPGPVGLGDTAWQPCYRTPVIPNDVRALATGQFNQVPIINGCNRHEGRLFATGAIEQLPDEQAYQKNLQIQFGSQAHRVAASYPVRNYDSIALAYAAYMTDWLFASPAYRANLAMSRYTPVYAYEFNDHDAPIELEAPAEIGHFGAFHTAEIQYIFQTAVPAFANPARFTPAQAQLSEQIQHAWVSFAREGVPSFASSRVWPAVGAHQMSIVNFDVSGPEFVGDFASDHQCGFWLSLP